MSQPNRTGVAGRLAEVRRQVPDDVLRLAYHAALPMVIDTGLLSLLRVNFFLDPPEVLPFEAEAALLLSPLFREIGGCLYDMLPEVRSILLVGLRTSYGSERIRQVALLLEQYSTAAWSTQPRLKRAQQLTALSFVEPVQATQWLESAHADAKAAMTGQEWHIEMRQRLEAQPPPERAPREVARAMRKLGDKSQEMRLAAVRGLAALAQLPGTDIAPAREALLAMTRYRPDVDAPDVRAAVALLRTLGGDSGTGAAVRVGRDSPQRSAISVPPGMAPKDVAELGARNAERGRLDEVRNLSDALAALEETVAIYRGLARSRPDAVPALVIAVNDLAQVLSSLGHTNEAVLQYQELLPDQARVLGPDHPDTLTTRRNIAFWTGECGRPATALRLYQELLPDQARVLGPDHPDTLTTRRKIAFWTGECGQPATALGLYQELLPDQARVLGPDHQNTLAIRGNIAFWTNAIGRPATALRLYEELLPDEERVLGPNHHNTKATRSNIEALTDSGPGPESDFFH